MTKRFWAVPLGSLPVRRDRLEVTTPAEVATPAAPPRDHCNAFVVTEGRQSPKSAVNKTARRRSYVTLPADLWPPTRHWRPGYSRQNTITLAAALQTPTRAGPTPNISQACWRQSSASLTAARQPPTGLFGGHSTAGYLTELWRQKRQVPTADGRCGLGGQSVSRQSCVRLPAARLPPN